MERAPGATLWIVEAWRPDWTREGTRRRLAVGLVLGVAAAGLGCAQAGLLQLDEVRGRVVDRDDGSPIAAALVMEVYVRGGPSDAARPEVHGRTTRSDPEGFFHFPAGTAAVTPGLHEVHGPRLAFYHGEYGLIRGAREDPADRGRRILRGSKSEASLRLADLAPYCRGEFRGRAARELAAVACSDAKASRPE